ncbi:GlxA family transcriptional regulator [Halodurantibacterium flavum]
MTERATIPPLDVGLLVMPNASLLTLGSIVDPMRVANRHLGHRAYRWRILSDDGAPVPLTCGVHLPVDAALADAADPPPEVLAVLAGYGARDMARGRIVPALRRAARGARLIVAVDSGSWLLAAAGLMQGRRATTHWEDLEDFAARHPEVDLVPDRYVMDGRLLSAGGAGPAQDMMLTLIEARHGPALAMEVAGTFILTRRPPSESQRLAIAAGARSGGDPRVAAAIARMEGRLDTPEPVAETARAVGLSLRRLQALFSREIGMAPKDYALELRLQAARRLVADSHAPLSEIALRCGFSAQSALSRAYRARFGEPPSALRRR